MADEDKGLVKCERELVQQYGLPDNEHVLFSRQECEGSDTTSDRRMSARVTGR